MGSIKTLQLIKPGALFFKYKTDATGVAISFGQLLREFSDSKVKNQVKQKLEGSSLSVSHVLIYIGNGRVVEAIASGVQVSSLWNNHNVTGHFEVYNPNNEEMAAIALKLARAAAYGKGGYSHGGLVNAGVASVVSLLSKASSPVAGLLSAITKVNVGDVFKPSQKTYHESLLRFTTKIENHEHVDFFCSELAAFCYDAAALKMNIPLIASDFSHHCTPKDLLADISSSQYFDYAGGFEPLDINLSDISVKHELHEGDSLEEGGYLLSPNRQYKLIYQHDGELALYKVESDNSMEMKWASLTKGKGTLGVMMQYDGDLVVWDNVPVFNTPKISFHGIIPNAKGILDSIKGTSDAVWSAGARSDQPNKRCVITDEGSLLLMHSDNTVYHSIYSEGQKGGFA